MKTEDPGDDDWLEQYTRKTRRAYFLEEMEQVVPCASCTRWWRRIIPSLGMGGRRWESGANAADLLFAAVGSTCRTRGWKGAVRSVVMRQFGH